MALALSPQYKVPIQSTKQWTESTPTCLNLVGAAGWCHWVIIIIIRVHFFQNITIVSLNFVSLQLHSSITGVLSGRPEGVYKKKRRFIAWQLSGAEI